MNLVRIPAHLVKAGHKVFKDLNDDPWTVTKVRDLGNRIEIHYGLFYEWRNVNALIVIGE